MTIKLRDPNGTMPPKTRPQGALSTVAQSPSYTPPPNRLAALDGGRRNRRAEMNQ
jgi:hypothetical protein